MKLNLTINFKLSIKRKYDRSKKKKRISEKYRNELKTIDNFKICESKKSKSETHKDKR